MSIHKKASSSTALAGAVSIGLLFGMAPDKAQAQNSLDLPTTPDIEFTDPDFNNAQPPIGASPLFMELYDAEKSASLSARLHATLGGENTVYVINWDGANLFDHSKEELLQLRYELMAIGRVDFSEHDPFLSYEETKEQLETIYASHDSDDLAGVIYDHYLDAKARTASLPDTEQRSAVIFYGSDSNINILASFYTPYVLPSMAEIENRNRMNDDFTYRHEACHGIDINSYIPSSERFNTDDFKVNFQGAEGPINLAENYDEYITEQFADACVALEYIIENNAEGIELMHKVSDYRNAGTLSNTNIAIENAMVMSQKQGTSFEHEMSREFSEYFLGHDTGPAIDAMLKMGERFSEAEKETLRQNPQAFEALVREVTLNSAHTPKEFVTMANEIVALAQDSSISLSPETKDLYERGFAGRTATIEHNLNIPSGSIESLSEIAPESTQAMASEATQHYLSTEGNPIKNIYDNTNPSYLSQASMEERIIVGKTYSIASSFEVLESTGYISSEVHIEPGNIKGDLNSFYQRTTLSIMAEAGRELSQIASRTVDDLPHKEGFDLDR